MCVIIEKREANDYGIFPFVWASSASSFFFFSFPFHVSVNKVTTMMKKKGIKQSEGGRVANGRRNQESKGGGEMASILLSKIKAEKKSYKI